MNSTAYNKLAERPALSAIVLVKDSYDSIRQLMDCLRRQTTAGQIEIVFVSPSAAQLKLREPELECFHSWLVVEIGRIKSIAHGYAAGIRRAQAPVVALTQDHAFPDSRWAELFIAAHQQEWAAVGPRVTNGNPDTTVSWADFYISYGEWTHPDSSGAVRHLPGHNSSYKLRVLLEYEDELDYLLEAESILHRRLNAAGYKLMLESNTCTAHLNYASWSSWLPKRYYQGRQFASTWARLWSRSRRFMFVAGSPLIPWIRLGRIQGHVRREQGSGFLLKLMPSLVLGLLAEGIGQATGYACGADNCLEKITRYEFDRLEHVKTVRTSKMADTGRVD